MSILGTVLGNVSLAAAIVGLTGCAVTSSAVRTGEAVAPYEGPVRLQSSPPPPDVAKQVGLVQAVGTDRLVEHVAPEFVRRVGEIGGDIAVVDHWSTRFETVMVTETYSYSCGTSTAPRTCTGTRFRRQVIATLQLVGRAYRSVGSAP